MEVIVLLADGFEEIEAVTIIDVLRRAGIDTLAVCTNSDTIVHGAHGIDVRADADLKDPRVHAARLVVLPGGGKGVENLRKNDQVMALLKERKGKPVAAICAAPAVLADAGLLEGKKVTSYPSWRSQVEPAALEYKEESVVEDDRITTSRGPGTAMDFALTLVEQLRSKTIAEELRQALLASS